jgi:hypothetical protein
MTAQVIDRELERLEALWDDGLSDAYRAYLGAVRDFDGASRQKLALAAGMVEVGIRLQSLGDRAAPPALLLLGDLCLARASRLLADAAPQPVQVAFATAIESMSLAAAAGQPQPAAREFLVRAFEAGR